MSGQVMWLHIKEAHGRPMRTVPEVIAVSGKGLQGDASFGRTRRQVLLVSQSTLEDLGLPPGAVRENITISGLALEDLASGTCLQVGAALLEITDDCAPCGQMDALRPGLRESIRGRRGMLARVRQGGTIRQGDAVSVVDCPANR